MKTKIISSLLIAATIAGCAGRSANPVMVSQFGDEAKTCQAIRSELTSIENNVQRLVPQTQKTGKNAALGVAGLFVWPAWLFMDLSTAEKEEINAFRARHDHLVRIAESKQCKIGNSNIA